MIIKGTQGDKLYWDVYEHLVPIELLDQIDFFYKGSLLHPISEDEKFSQDEICHLASRVLVLGDGSEVKYNNCTAKCKKVGESYQVYFVKEAKNKKLSLTTFNSKDLQAAIVIFEKNGKEKDRIYLNSEGERFVSNGTHFRFRKNKEEDLNESEGLEK